MHAKPSFVLSARNLCLSRGANTILHDVSLTVSGSTCMGVIGPNGVGKTTLLRILAGLELPDTGTVTRMPPGLNVGYLAQEPDRHHAESLMSYLCRRTGVAGAEAQLNQASGDLAGDDPGAPDRYSAALERYLALGGPDIEARAATVCAGLGLARESLTTATGALSGGEAARAGLAALLLSRFDVLLLDEPTNNLDFPGLEALERFLEHPPGGVVVVSHDRTFLEATISSVLEIQEADHQATDYRGGWEAYLHARETARNHAESDYEVYANTKAELAERARRQRQWASSGRTMEKRRPKDNDKAQRDFRLNRTEKQASKVQSTERALDRLVRVAKPWQGWDLKLEIASAPRSGDVVVRLTHAVIERGAWRLGPLDVEIAWGERIGILGPNGSGKTSLLAALLGRLPLSGGTRWIGPGVVVGELGQGRDR
ncbi:MAG: ATP-binding cassette domain-containing protein, partial [Acidimicrobiales bacterium]